MKTLKNKGKKGFTIVELVIVIAVIAILAAVLIPTFTNVVSSAKESAAMQESRNEWTNYLVEIAADGEYTSKTYYVGYNDTYVFEIVNGEFDTEPVQTFSDSDDYDVYITALENDGYIEIQYTYAPSNSNVAIYADKTGTTDGATEAAAAEMIDALTAPTADKTYYANVADSDNNWYFNLTATVDNTTVTWTAKTIAKTTYTSVAEDTTNYGAVSSLSSTSYSTFVAYTAN